MNQTIQFLIEARKRLLITISIFCLLFAIFFYFSDTLFYGYMQPLQHVLSSHQHLIATQITGPLLTPLSMAMNVALLCTVPIALLQMWYFAAPALYRVEQRKLQVVLVLGFSLFLLGALFCYSLVLPTMFRCIMHALPNDVLFFPDIGSAAHFITWMMIVFGLSFQIPLICAVLVHVQWVQIQQLIALRPYAIVAAFTLGMLLTPPDVLSQILLALPLWGLFESGIFLARMRS
ncbi:MAG: twin-arginine translocase subunit TatC [Gammaproteobacteria bacterium]|nr:twin-arginine translocase subunit TatC [Gammaproteobacteria bacterium]